jgi:hypothetical protein
MAMVFTCPGSCQKGRFPGDFKGDRIKCPNCQALSRAADTKGPTPLLRGLIARAIAAVVLVVGVGAISVVAPAADAHSTDLVQRMRQTNPSRMLWYDLLDRSRSSRGDQAIEHARPGRFIVEVVSPAGKLLPSGRSCRRWGTAIRHPNGQVTLDLEPWPECFRIPRCRPCNECH